MTDLHAVLGEKLNTVPDRACYRCGRRGPMRVFEKAVVWACGHRRSLPPLPTSSSRRRCA